MHQRIHANVMSVLKVRVLVVKYTKKKKNRSTLNSVVSDVSAGLMVCLGRTISTFLTTILLNLSSCFVVYSFA